jgi:hypothetical protein
MAMPRLYPAVFATLLSLNLCFPAQAVASDWKPIDPAHLALKTPKVQPTADAEALLWEVRVADELSPYGELSTVFQHYVRVKIFTDRGRESHATVDIPHLSGTDIKDVAARTVRADGSIVELKKSDIYRRTVLKANDLKIKTVSFAVPAIDRGAIVEYRWREVHKDSLAANLRLLFSRDIPVHDVRYYIRPLAVPGFSMVSWPFNGEFSPPVKQDDGYWMMSLSNVPADVDEAYAVPVYEQRPWVFIGYEPRGRSASASYARDLAKELHEYYSNRSKPNDAIRALATQALGSATTDAERVATLVRTARSKVRRVDVDTASADDWRKIREAKNAGDVLNRGLGTGDDVVLLVLALARSVGLDARVAAIGSGAELFPRSVRNHPYFVRGRIVAVRSGSGWVFADPSNEYASSGELPWEFEGQQALIADGRDATQVATPSAPGTYSVRKRTGNFRLLDDGTLEGEARLEYTGHWASFFREQEDQDDPSEREKDLRDLLTSRLPGAELSDVHIEHVTTTDGPYTNRFQIRVPGFAQRTGSRLFLQPGFFQKGVAALFAGTDRKSAVHFRFPWTEEDTVTIDLPDGYTIEESGARKLFDVGAASYDASVTAAGKQVVLRRKVVIDGIFFEPAHYKALRAFFDAVHRADSHAIVLRRSGT